MQNNGAHRRDASFDSQPICKGVHVESYLESYVESYLESDPESIRYFTRELLSSSPK